MIIEQAAHVNPLLQKIKLPGKIFQLPSRGIFYTNNELNKMVKDGEIHVHPMSAIDEINMKNPDMLFSGRAIEEVCKSCIPDIIDPYQLLARDVDAIMLFLRMVTYGNIFEIEIKHTCENAKEHSYNVNLEAILNTMAYLDPTESTEKYSIDMPNGQVIRIQPAKYQHVVELLQRNEKRKEYSSKDIADNIIHNLLNLIVDVDGITDKKDIEEWLRQVPATFVTKLAKSIEELNQWGPSTVTEITCKDCGEQVKLELPLNPISFFSE